MVLLVIQGRSGEERNTRSPGSPNPQPKSHCQKPVGGNISVCHGHQLSLGAGHEKVLQLYLGHPLRLVWLPD